MIFINEVYMNVNDNEYIRIIDIDDEINTLYYVICFKTYAYPKPYNISVFNDELDKEFFIKVPDMFQKVINESTLNEKEVVRRNYYWEIVDKYWNINKDELLSKSNYNNLFTIISEEYKISLSTVKRIFSNFFERGMSKNSLLPQYANSGGKGKERKFDSIKTGRPKKYDGINVRSGIIITDDIKIIFQKGLDKYYYNKKKYSIKETYNSILTEYFSYKYYENGEMKNKLFEEEKLPTYEQFYYWFRKNKNETKNIIDRQSENYFNLNNRPILSNSTSETIGPGTRFQVDATIADIYLVSKFDRHRIIGRPIVYAIIDVFSRLVTGIYVGLEGPSWVGAMMALDNMVADKYEFCQEYGINIEENDWPAHHLPQIIIADRGEFEGYSVENLINNLGITIENTPPYRGDLKGYVERSFRTLNEKVKHKTPGAIMKEYRQRGDRDYRLDATLTIEEFYKIYIKLILTHNSTIIEKYPMEVDMITDQILPIPTELWGWGIKNRKGGLRVINRDIMRLNVMPKAKASVSRHGIRFQGMFYSSEKAIQEQWFIRNKIRSINIVYDPRKIDNIYIVNEDGKSFEKCYLLDSSQQYKETYLEEVMFVKELKEESLIKIKHENLQLKSDLDRFIDKVSDVANKAKKTSIPLIHQSKTSKIKDIKNNRIIEKEINRNSEGFELGKKSNIQMPIIIDDNTNEESDKKKQILFEKIRKIRDEKLGKH